MDTPPPPISATAGTGVHFPPRCRKIQAYPSKADPCMYVADVLSIISWICCSFLQSRPYSTCSILPRCKHIKQDKVRILTKCKAQDYHAQLNGQKEESCDFPQNLEKNNTMQRYKVRQPNEWDWKRSSHGDRKSCLKIEKTLPNMCWLAHSHSHALSESIISGAEVQWNI